MNLSLPPTALLSAEPKAGARAENRLYYVLLLLIAAVRLGFIFKGTRSSYDESRYSFSLRALDSLLKHDVTHFFYYLSSTAGRPGAALVNLIPASVQGALYFLFGLNPDTPDSYLVPVLFNCGMLLVSMYLLYRIGLLVLRDREVALTVVVVYSCLINTNVYLRHMLPYDTAIALSLFIVLKVLTLLRQGYQVTRRQAISVGALSMLLFAVYPGYYIMMPIAGLLLVDWRHLFSRMITHLRLGLFYLLGVLAVFLFFEGLARLGGVSYVERSSTLAETITQGSFEEGFSFLFKYLYQVEGALGVVLILCMDASLLLLVRQIRRQGFTRFCLTTISEPRGILLLGFLAGFLFHASLSYFFHKMVFYGRLLHPYFPYIMLYCVGNVLLEARRYFAKAPLVLAGLALASFGVFSVAFIKLDYPRDILYKYGIDTTAPNVRYVEEVASLPDLRYKSPMVFRKGDAYTTYPGRITLVNCTTLYPVVEETYKAYVPPPNSKVLYEGTNFCEFPAYLLEGMNVQERECMRNHDFRFIIYLE